MKIKNENCKLKIAQIKRRKLPIFNLQFAIYALLLIALPLSARTKDVGPVRKGGAARIDVGKKSLFAHDVGNVRMTLSNWGEQGNPDATPGYLGFEYPLGSESDFLFSAGIWVGAKVNQQPLVSTGTDGDNGTNEFAPSLPIQDGFPWSYFPLSSITDNIAGRTYIKGAKQVDDDGDGLIDEDPAGDMSADFIDNDGDGKVDDDDDDNDGDVVPGSLDDDGDGRFDEDSNARGTQEYYTVYDDCDVSQVQSADADGHTPLNVQVLQRTYAWGEAYASEFILMDLIVRNIGALPLMDLYLGLFADPDVAAKGESGDPASIDDWNFYDAANLMMVQGDDTTDADGYGPGLFAMKVVRTPDSLHTLKISFSNFERVSGGDPETNADKYELLTSGVIMPPTAQLGDWRFLLGFGPASGSWILPPGDEMPVTVAFIAGRKLEDLRRNAQWAQAIYDNDFQGPQAPEQPIFWTESHPGRIRVYWRNNAEKSIDPITRVADFEGYAVQRSTDINRWFTLGQFDKINPDSIFDEEFRRENLNLGMPYDVFDSTLAVNADNGGWYVDGTHSPPDTVYWLDDRNVLRGWQYYYIVRAFDRGVSGAGVLITSIGRSYKGALAGYTQETWTQGNSVEQVFVVPNPYKGGHELEESGALTASGLKAYPRKLFFMNLPPSGAKIHIYTLAGDHIITLQHPSGGSDQFEWDMRNQYRQEIVSGVYYYIVEAGAEKKIDKFVVIK